METRVVNAIEFRCDFKDFVDSDEKVREWQKAYFNLLTWKNTWGFTWDMDILSHADHTPFVRIVIEDKGSLEENTLEMLETYGYRNVKVDKYKIRLFDMYGDFEDDLDNEVYGYYFE